MSLAKICILLPSHWGAARGGAEYQAHLFAQYLHRSTSHEVVYLARRVPRQWEKSSYRLVRFGGATHPRYGFFWDTFSLYRCLIDLKPDLILQRVACAYTGIAAYYARKERVALVWHISSDMDVAQRPNLATHGVPGSIDARMFKFGVRHASCIVAQTHAQESLLREAYGRNAAAVVPNFHDLPVGNSHRGPRLTVLWIANLKRLKRPEIFLDLARDLKAHDIGFKVIGRRDDSVWGDEIFERISTSRNVEYVGELEVEEVNAQLEQSHLLVSTSEFEGLPNTFIQAWMRGVPTVTLNIDPDEVISEHQLGIRAQDYDALRRSVLYLYENRKDLERLGRNAMDFATKKYSMKNATILADLLDGVLAASRTRTQKHCHE